MKDKIKITKDLSVPEGAGTYFRILCMTGKNKGVAYFLNANRLIMGRGDGADIQIADDKSSRVHGELVRSEGTYVLTDLKSANGIMVNEVKIVQQKLNDGDKIVIGRVVFKFGIINVRKKYLMDKNVESDVEVIDGDETAGKDADEKKSVNKSKKIIVYGIVLLAIYFVLFEEEPSRKPTASENNTINNISGTDTIGVVEKYSEGQREERNSINEEYIHRGQREFREGNYFRAIDEFNMALILAPRDGNAGFYLNKTKQALNNHVKFMFEKGGREYDQLKYRGAIKSYCEIVKLLHKYPNDDRYKNAKEQIKFIGEKIGFNKEEYQCWEENTGED